MASMIADILIFSGAMIVFAVLVAKFYQWIFNKELAQLESTRTVEEPEDAQKVFKSEDLWEDEK